MIYPSINISIGILAPRDTVYRFLSNPENLPKWAQGLSQSELHKRGEFWETDSPMGKVKIKFAQENVFGVVDHDVFLPSGEVNHNPLRVVKNGDGCEVIFTLYRPPQMDDGGFAQDAQMVERDLQKLKSLF